MARESKGEVNERELIARRTSIDLEGFIVVGRGVAIRRSAFALGTKVIDGQASIHTSYIAMEAEGRETEIQAVATSKRNFWKALEATRCSLENHM